MGNIHNLEMYVEDEYIEKLLSNIYINKLKKNKITKKQSYSDDNLLRYISKYSNSLMNMRDKKPLRRKSISCINSFNEKIDIDKEIIKLIALFSMKINDENKQEFTKTLTKWNELYNINTNEPSSSIHFLVYLPFMKYQFKIMIDEELGFQNWSCKQKKLEIIKNGINNYKLTQISNEVDNCNCIREKLVRDKQISFSMGNQKMDAQNIFSIICSLMKGGSSFTENNGTIISNDVKNQINNKKLLEENIIKGDKNVKALKDSQKDNKNEQESKKKNEQNVSVLNKNEKIEISNISDVSKVNDISNNLPNKVKNSNDDKKVNYVTRVTNEVSTSSHVNNQNNSKMKKTNKSNQLNNSNSNINKNNEKVLANKIINNKKIDAFYNNNYPNPKDYVYNPQLTPLFYTKHMNYDYKSHINFIGNQKYIVINEIDNISENSTYCNIKIPPHVLLHHLLTRCKNNKDYSEFSMSFRYRKKFTTFVYCVPNKKEN